MVTIKIITKSKPIEGQGQFGNVYLVEDDQKNGYALKTISKARVYSLCLEKHIQDERRVLKILNSPFIMKFFRTYKDDKNVYFLTEYIRGMELFDVIREIGLLTKPEAQFYVGSVILAIEYLHRQKIIYRDVKPENIMIDCTVISPSKPQFIELLRVIQNSLIWEHVKHSANQVLEHLL